MDDKPKLSEDRLQKLAQARQKALEKRKELAQERATQRERFVNEFIEAPVILSDRQKKLAIKEAKQAKTTKQTTKQSKQEVAEVAEVAEVENEVAEVAEVELPTQPTVRRTKQPKLILETSSSDDEEIFSAKVYKIKRRSTQAPVQTPPAQPPAPPPPPDPFAMTYATLFSSQKNYL